MKTITKTSKAILFALLAMIICVAMALTACNGKDEKPVDGITKYDATLDASITMGSMGSIALGNGLIESSYVTVKDGKYTLTLVFTVGELTVANMTKNVFVDSNPENPQTVGGIKDGTIGYYNENGTLVTSGVKLTYSSGDNYETNEQQNSVYYVKSAEFAVDSLRASYDVTLYINSPMKGAQFTNDTHKATVTLNLESGEVVNAITGLGVDTLGTVPPVEQDPEPVVEKYAKYEAQLDGKVKMGQQEINFTETLFDGVYAIKKDGKYEITLIFKTGEVSIFNNKMTAFLTTAETQGYGGTVTPVYGYYAGETLVTEGITLTYSSGDNYVTNKNGSYYYVQSMSFVVDELASNYDLSIYVLAGNDSSVSGMQFPYTMSNGSVSKATLTLDLDQSEAVDSIDSLLGVDTLGTVPPAEPEYEYTKYDAELSCVVTVMNADIAVGIVDSVYISEKDGKTYMTVIFNKSQATVMTITVDTFVDDTPANAGSSKGVQDGTIGYYKADGTLVTDGISLTYSSGDDYATDKDSNNVYYVKSATFEVDSLRSEYKLAIFINSSFMGAQFCEPNANASTTYSAVLTLDLESGEGLDSIDDLLGVETKDEVPDPEYQVAIVSLDTSAPLPAVKEAFNKAFGESVTLIVAKDGSKKLRIKNEHMVIHMSKDNDFDANVALVRGATVISTKTELCASMSGATEEIEVPDVFEIEYPADCNGVLTLDISVDFMAKMYNQSIEDYSTNVTLTIDISSLDL